MSSFISDSAIGMGGSDSGGSIQQPLVDREVISIDGSSLEKTHHGASNNDSSSSERLTISRHASGGTSRFYGRVQSFVASPVGEPIPVTMILPLLFLGEQGRVVAGMLRHTLCVA